MRLATELTLIDTPLSDHDLLHLMALSREGDRREGILLRQGKGWFQVSATGHEALVAAATALTPQDYIFPYYRDRAITLGRGISNYELALAYFAKKASSSGGRQMPGHYSDRARNIFSVATPTASQCLPAAGAAWGFKLAGTSQVALTTIGDASTRQGEYYEAVAFAVQEQLPLVFLLEDNRFGISTPTDGMMPYHLGIMSDTHVVRIDARDPHIVAEATRAAVDKARSGGGPTIVWCDLDRLCSHTSSDDQRSYRPAEDLARDAERDPITLFAGRLIAQGVLTSAEWEAELAEIQRTVDDDYQRAEAAADPLPETVTDHLRRPAGAAKSFAKTAGCANMVTAVNATLRQALESVPEAILFGEDIADPKGGVFGITKGLSKDYPNRVFNAPLAEATIVGTAVGLAASGWRPVFELQFIDFIDTGLSQLLNQATSLRWRSNGAWTCPMTLIAPYGAYLPGGSLWHSESNEGIWAHIHGLNIAIPSTLTDAAGLLWTAINGNDPTLFLLPKHIFRKRMDPVPDVAAVPFGKARVHRHGSDVTLVTWGNCIELADEAADIAAADGVSVEIIDPRTISPFDYQAVESSLAKTGRLIVVHEDGRTTGFGATIVAEMTTKPERWNLFLSPPQLVARKDVPIPFNPILEFAALPSVDDIVDAIGVVMA